MALSAGTRIGPYEITAPIGEGGMGEVYRATDTHLGRPAAIKVLPETFALDADRVARFEREARTLASLNHPNIAQVFGLEKGASGLALAMELVEGPTLADLIARGALTLDDAIPMARQIAEALEAAHDQGIVHRDLKPANVKVRDDATRCSPAGARFRAKTSATCWSPCCVTNRTRAPCPPPRPAISGRCSIAACRRIRASGCRTSAARA
jgi:serine/threonine protein kinase